MGKHISPTVFASAAVRAQRPASAGRFPDQTRIGREDAPLPRVARVRAALEQRGLRPPPDHRRQPLGRHVEDLSHNARQ